MSTIPTIRRPDADEALEGVDEPTALIPQEVDPTSAVRAIDVEEELERLCAEPATPRVAAGQTAEQQPAQELGEDQGPGDGLDELEADLRQAMAEVRVGQTIKDKRRRLALVGDLTAAEREQLALTVHQWEAANEWISLDVVLVVEHQRCTNCTAVHESTFGVYEHQRSRRKDGGFRWTKYWPSAEGSALPRRVAVKFCEVSICVTCAEKQGFAEITELGW